MPLGMFRGVNQEPEAGRWQPGASNLARLEQPVGVAPAEFGEGEVQLAGEGGAEGFGSVRRRARRALGFQCLELRGRERFSPGVGEEPIQDAGEVLEMEADGREPGGTGPELCVGKILENFTKLLARLEQCMGDGLKLWRDAGDWPAQPDLG